MTSQASALPSLFPVFVLAPSPLADVLEEALSSAEITITILAGTAEAVRHASNGAPSAFFVELDWMSPERATRLVSELHRMRPGWNCFITDHSELVRLAGNARMKESLSTAPVISSSLAKEEIAAAAREVLGDFLSRIAPSANVTQPAAQNASAGEEVVSRPRVKSRPRTEELANQSSLPFAASEQNDAGDDAAEFDPAVAMRLAELGYIVRESNVDLPTAVREAVRAFQRSRGIAPDGILGPATRAALLGTQSEPRPQHVREVAEELGVAPEELLKGAQGEGMDVRDTTSYPPLGFEDRTRRTVPKQSQASAETEEEKVDSLSISASGGIGFALALADMRTDRPGEVDSVLLFAGLLIRTPLFSWDTTIFLEEYLRKQTSRWGYVATFVRAERLGITSPPARPARIPPLDTLPASALRSVLELAREYAAQVRDDGGTGPATVSARHLVAALLTGTPAFRAEARLEEMGVSLYDLRQRFLAFLASHPSDESLEAWRGILIPGFFTEVSPPARYAADAVEEEGVDQLGITSEVNALAAVLAARDASLPISVGLFGDWGMGKSFFMQQMEKRIRAFAGAAAKTPESPFCADVVQIRFNAWHYMDANLWASMVAEVFRGLAEELEKTSRLTPAEVQARIRARLEEKQGYAAELKRREAGIREEIDRVAAQARQTESVLRAAGDALADTLDHPEVRERLVALAASVGLSDPAFAELQAQTGELRTLRGRIGKLLERRPSRGELAYALVFVGAAPLAAWAITQMLNAPGVVQGIAAVAGAAAAVVARGVEWARPVLRQMQGFVTEMEGLSERVDQAAARHREEVERRQAEFRDQMERLEREQAAVLESQREAARQVGALEAELHDLADERRFLNFVLERSAAADYRQHQGIIALVRRDFQELTRLLGDVRENSDGERDASLPRVERIILYIDDLDRCPEERVVEVLQAVHLLLAFPLFVVVVGVDSRWLLRSVQGHYSRFFSTGEGADADPEDARHWRSTPQNYLEKIFQIPFTLRPMDGRGFASLIGSLVPVTGDEGAEDGAERGSTGRTEPPGADSAAETGEGAVDAAREGTPAAVEPRAAPGTQAAAGEGDAMTAGESRDGTVPKGPPPAEPAPRSLEVERWERAFMQDLAPLIPSPRAAKRFVNVYRFIRAGTGKARLDAFRGTAAAPGEHRVVALLLAVVTGYPAQAEVLFRALEAAGDADAPGSWWGTVERLEAEASSAAADVGWRELLRTLLAMRPELGIEELPVKPFAYWAPHVARFSFQTGRALARRRG